MIVYKHYSGINTIKSIKGIALELKLCVWIIDVGALILSVNRFHCIPNAILCCYVVLLWQEHSIHSIQVTLSGMDTCSSSSWL